MEKQVLYVVVIAIHICNGHSAVTIAAPSSPSIDMTVEIRSSTTARQEESEIINQNDEIFVGPVSNNLINSPTIMSISNTNIKPVRKHFEFLFSKTGLFNDLFLSVNKWTQRRPSIPTFQPAIQDNNKNIGLVVQRPQDELVAGAAAAGAELSQHQQQQSYQLIQPSLELSIKGPPIPNIQPLINAVPAALITGYKSLVDKISATSFVWDKTIQLPFLSVRKSGRLGASSSSSPPTTLISGTGLQHNDVGDSQINTFIDIRDPVSS